MAFQILGLASVIARSISSAFQKKEQQDVLQGLLQDVVNLRNTVDILVSAVNTYATGTVTFASAAVGDDITVGATEFVATEGAVTPGDATYQCDAASDALVAASFAEQVAAHAVASLVVTPIAADAVVTLTAVTPGTAGNAVVLTSVDGATTAVTGSGTLAGALATGAGVAPATVRTTL